MKHYLIYKITNNINGMIYIGKHETFKVDDNYMGSGIYLIRAQKKYGIENFEKEILFDFNTYDEMNKKEEELVNEEFIKRKDTYNIMLGGRGSFSFLTEEQKKEISLKGLYPRLKKLKELRNDPIWFEKFKQNCSNGQIKSYENGRVNGFTNCSHTAETKNKISESKKGQITWNKNIPRKEETKKKISKTLKNKGIKPPSAKDTILICNRSLNKNKRIHKDDIIPEGWERGMIIKNKNGS